MDALMRMLAGTCLLLMVTCATSGAAPVAASEELARQVLAETNLARSEPGRYAAHLREMRPLYVGKAYRLPGSVAMVLTREGVAALDEAIDFLSRQDPLPALAWSQGLAQAAADLVRDQARTGETGHDGGSSGGMRQRIERHGSWSGRIAENISYGPSRARLVVIELIVDDGVPGRGHRDNIFNSAFAVAGVACGPHPVYRKMCVTDFASQFKGRGKR
jgi:uncharacterized protein YkwD